jgi:hypothetical protein
MPGWPDASMFAGVGQYSGLAQDLCLRRRFWIQMDYIGWWGKGNALPVLATTSPPGTSFLDIISATPPTTVLFGGNSVDTQIQNGARINAGFWLTDDQLWAIEEQVFYLAPIGTSFNVNSLNTSIIARPFLLEPGDIPAAFPVSDTASGIVGSLNIETTANVLGAGILLRRRLWMSGEARLDILGGYRFLRLQDSVTIIQNTTLPGPPPPFPPLPSGTPISLTDVFSATNYFNGGDVGLKFQKYWNRFSVEAITKLAMGNVTERVVIKGNGFIGGVALPFGLLAQSSNIGTFSRNVFGLLPELDVNVRVDITQNLRAVVGYNLLYLSKVQRSGNAIDPRINPAATINPAAGPPFFSFDDSSYWLQGINVGFEYRF